MQTATTPVHKGVLNHIQERIIIAACAHFDVSELQLLTETDYHYVYIRQLCFYLVSENTVLNPRFIGCRFNRSRNAVKYGIEIIDSRVCIAKTKNIYGQTLGDLNKIAELAAISCVK